MAKIVRYSGNLQAFASAAIGTERTIFGDVTQANDLTSQINADFLRGWGIVGPSDQPSLEDFNGAMYTHGQLLAYLHQAGVAEYDSAQEYFSGSITQSAGVAYISLQNSNTGNAPASSPTFWRSMSPAGRLLRTSVYSSIAGVQNVSVNGGAPTTTGAGTFVALAATGAVRIKCQGAGGGSGGSAATGSGTLSVGGGGGGGSYAEGYFSSAFSGLAVTVGTGGSAGPAGSGSGGSGGSSSVGGIITSPGGNGSQSAGSASAQGGFFGGSAQSSAPTGGNILSIRGSGGLYGTQWAAISANAAGGYGGGSVFGGGAIPASPSSTSPGIAGINPGSGAAGGQSNVSSAAQPGAAGAPGIVIIEEYA